MLKKIYTTCTLDCPDGCGIIAHVEDNKVVKLEGHPDHEFTRGYLCGKTYQFPKQRMYSPERQLYPMVRKNGDPSQEWERTDWDTALDLVASKIKLYMEASPLSIMHYQRTGSWGATKNLSKRFWNLLGGVTTTRGSICSGAARAGQALDFGYRNGHDPSDYINSNVMILWGRNPMATNFHMIAVMKEIRKKGCKIILVDPIRSESAGSCDMHIQPKVARDAELAMAMARIILEEGLHDQEFLDNYTNGFEEYLELLNSKSISELCDACELPEETVREFARIYANGKPSSILLGWGLNKYKHSAEMFRCVDALAAICGFIGVSGGGVTHGFDTKRHFDSSVDASERVKFKRSIMEPVLGRALLEADPPVSMMFINGGNPVNQSPNSNLVAKAFKQLEFVVVVDQFLTDTTDYAHVFLPTTTFLEEEDMLVSWGHNVIGGLNPVVPAPGEARPDLLIFQQLADRLGIGEEMAGTPKEWLKRIFTPLEKQGVTVEQVLEGPVKCPTAPMVPFADRKFPTASGKFEFIRKLEHEHRVVPGYPLTLVTNFSKKWLLSQLTEKEHPTPFVRIGIECAEQYGIADRDKVVIRSEVGELEVEAQVDDRVGKGIVVMPVGTWMKRGGGANVLTEDVVTNYGEMAAFGETRVQLQRLAP